VTGLEFVWMAAVYGAAIGIWAWARFSRTATPDPWLVATVRDLLTQREVMMGEAVVRLL